MLALCNMRAGTGASAHKPIDSWLVQLSMLAADILFWAWLTLAAYAHAHPAHPAHHAHPAHLAPPAGFTAEPLMLEACLFAAMLAAFALHYSALLHAGVLHPGFALPLLLELAVLGAIGVLVGRQLLGGGGTPVFELLLNLQARTHGSHCLRLCTFRAFRTSAPSAPPQHGSTAVRQCGSAAVRLASE